MKPEEAVQRIKKDLASYSESGEASRLRGIIVSPEVWQALNDDSENFHGVIGVRGREGNRSLHYSFYILENKNFPKNSAFPYFFVCHSKMGYKERYLGREDEILASKEQPGVEITPGLKITSLNPIMGIVVIEQYGSGRYLYNVDFDGVVAALKQTIESEKSISLANFTRPKLVHNIPETSWIKDEPTYNYHKANIKASIGRLLMKRIATGNQWEPDLYQIVGIGLDGFGQIVEVVMKESGKHNPYEFACFAARIFLPEEIADFLSQPDVEITPEWVSQIPIEEAWGSWYDRENIGRLKTLKIYGENISYGISGGFIGTRAKEYNVELVKTSNEDDWLKIKAQYFPNNWAGWPKTSHDRALEGFARTL